MSESDVQIRSYAGASPLPGRVVLYHPSSPDAGHGALLSEEAFAAIVERERREPTGFLAGVGPSGTLLTGESARLSDDAVPAISHIAIAATIPNDSGAATINKQWLVPLSIVGLVTLVLVGVGLTVRAVKKERLATRARAEFLTAVTHELKTPLASIRRLVDVLQDGRVVPRKRLDHQRALASEAARLTMLVENVLDLGRVERGEHSYDRRHEDTKTSRM